MVKHDVEVESLGKCVDEIDKPTELIGKHEADQYIGVCKSLSNLYIVNKFAPFKEECLKLGVNLKLLQWHLVDVHIIDKGSGQALSISKMKAARYHEFGLELLVPKHMWIDDVYTYDISASYAYSSYGFDYLKEITLRRANHQEYTIAEKDLKNLYPSEFEDLNLLLLQGHLNHLPSSDILVFLVSNNERKIMRFNEIYKFSDGTLTNIMEALDYRVKEYKVNRLNPGMDTRFWTDKDVERSKEFIHAIEQRLKARRIFQNLECFGPVTKRFLNLAH
ncbi:hypothetical protein Tco_0243094 [Tanacetum coccineum]